MIKQIALALSVGAAALGLLGSPTAPLPGVQTRAVAQTTTPDTSPTSDHSGYIIAWS